MIETINTSVLAQLNSHHRSLGLKYAVHGLPYERCAELTWVIDHLKPFFQHPLNYLDIGSGESPLPTFLREQSQWNITCIDKHDWVRKQSGFLRRRNLPGSGFRVIQDDLLHSELPAESFDVVTCISVIEHFEGESDSTAMVELARLLRPGGTLLLTTLVNDHYFGEFYENKPIYGTEYNGSPVYYQRHYDVKSLDARLIQPSHLVEKERVYFGDYGFQCFERILQLPKPVRALYAWNTQWLAARFLSYQRYPVSRKDMRVNTASGVILVLEKPIYDGAVH